MKGEKSMATLNDVTRNSNIQAIWDVVRRFTRGKWKETTIPSMPEIISMLSLTELTEVTIPAGSASPFLLATLDKAVKHAVIVYPKDTKSWTTLQNAITESALQYDTETGNLYLIFESLPESCTLIINDMLAADDAETEATLLTVPLQIQWHRTDRQYHQGDIVLYRRGERRTLAIANYDTEGAFDETKWTVLLSEEDFQASYGELDYRKSDKYFRTVTINADITLPLPATTSSLKSIGINPIQPDVADYSISLANHTISWTQSTKTLAVDNKEIYVNGVAQPAFSIQGVAWDGIAILTFNSGSEVPVKTTGTIPQGVFTVIDVEQTETVETNFLNLMSEIARAKSVEQGLRSDLTSEINRATTKEADLQSQMTAEVNRSTAKDNEHDTSIAAEISRAEAVEKVLTDNLNAEITQRKAKDVVSMSWDAPNNSIKATRTDSSTTSLALPLSDGGQNGLMSKQTYQQVQKNSQDIATLQGKGTRRLTPVAITPEPEPKPDATWQATMTNAWTASSGGIAPVDNDTLISSNASTLWRTATYVASSGVWVYRGADTLSIASPTELGIVLSTEPQDNTMEHGGSIFVEQGDGSMWVNGWDNATARITNLESFMNRTQGFATSSQGTKADTAVQAVVADTATENGKIKLLVNKGGTQVVVDATVAGLKSAAFTESSAYATAQQGKNADDALAGVQGAAADAAAAQTAASVAQTAAEQAANSATQANITAGNALDAANAATELVNQAIDGSSVNQADNNQTGDGQFRLVWGYVNDSTTTSSLIVTVKGLKSAAYTESSAYATAAQGTLADNAVRSITAGTAADNGKVRLVVNTGGTATNVDVAVTGLGSAAYTASSNYATAAQGTLATNAVRSVSLAASNTKGKVVLSVDRGGTTTTTNIDVCSDVINNTTPIKNSDGGFAGGYKATTTAGGAVGNSANSDFGGAVGVSASATVGGAIGANAVATSGGAVGNLASTDSGGAVGQFAKTSTGFAGGYSAKAVDSDGNGIDAVQLGWGTNNIHHSLQVYGDNLYNANTHQLSSALLDAIYPVGSVYISVKESSPASQFGGTWERLPTGYALWTTAHNTDTIIEAGLPNIVGEITGLSNSSIGTWSGALIATTQQQVTLRDGESTATRIKSISLDASKNNPIYGKSTTVQPPAYQVSAWKRVA